MEDKYLLRDARLVLPDRVIDRGSILIQGDRIAQILAAEANCADLPQIELGGLTLFPGFLDIHIHGAAGIDTMEADADGLEKAGAFLLEHGVTAWVPTFVPDAAERYRRAIDAIIEFRERMAVQARAGARVLGVHYEGPFVNDQQCGALHREHFRTFKNIDDLNSLPTLDQPGVVHMMTVAPEIDGGIELIKELASRGWVASIGHTRATTDVLDQAFAAGARHMTHFMNAMTGLHHRAPGPVGWGLMHDEVSCDLIADGIHLDPSILRLILRNKTAQRISLISDAIAATGLGDGEYEIWGEQIAVKNGRTRNVKGSIAGSVITMLDAVRMMSQLGFSDHELAEMSSLNPARLLGLDHDCGSIEAGKRADLVVLDQDLNVQMTVVGGDVLINDRYRS